jgi:hypothetical protein
MPGPVSLTSKCAISRAWLTFSRTSPSRVNLTALPSRLIRIWRSRFSSARTVAGSFRRSVDKAQALGRGLQLEHAGHLAHGVSANAMGFTSSFSLPDSMRAMSSVPSMSESRCSPPRWITRIACARCGAIGVFLQQLRVAQDAVERRAQLVADGADVAALGLVGLVGDFACLLQLLVGAAVRLDLLHQQPGLAVRLFLRHLAALVRQHQPPGHRAGDQQQHRIDRRKPERRAASSSWRRQRAPRPAPAPRPAGGTAGPAPPPAPARSPASAAGSGASPACR